MITDIIVIVIGAVAVTVIVAVIAYTVGEERGYCRGFEVGIRSKASPPPDCELPEGAVVFTPEGGFRIEPSDN